MYWIVEPHADDAYLSLHEHMTILWKVPKTIVTVFCEPKRLREIEAYCEVVGAQHINLGGIEGGGLSKAAGQVPSFDIWQRRIRSGDVVLMPLGLQHPDHLSVASVPLRSGTVWRYLDTPYYAKQKIGGELRAATLGKRIVSCHYASARKWKCIPLFKSQGCYFFHHPAESLPRLEMVLR